MIFVDKKLGRQAVVERRHKEKLDMRQKSRVGGISRPLDRGNKILDIIIYNASL